MQLQNSRGKWLNRIFYNLGIFQFLTFLRRGIFYTFMINYLYSLMHTATSTASLGTLNMVASALGQNLIWGKICDRYKARTRLIIAGETIAGITYILVFFAHRFLLDAGESFTAGLAIIFGLSFLEFFWSMSDVGWAALLTDVTTPKIRGRIVGILNFVASLGRMVGIFVAGFLYAGGEGFRNGTIFFTVVLLLFAGAALMAFISTRVKKANFTQTQNITVAETENTRETSVGNEKAYNWFLAALIIIVLGASCINQIFLLFIKLPSGLNASDGEMSIIISAWTVGGMIASATSGRLADKIGREKTILAALVLAIITPLLYGVAANFLLMALIYGLNGISFWSIQTVSFTLAGDLIPETKRGRLFSRYNTVIALSWGPAGILIGGPLADIQVKILGATEYTAFLNTFYVSSIIVALGTALFSIKFLKKPATEQPKL
ncbi:MFS transporter [Candidatus Bathyarchaeota archaeon]|nr:MFS transporter [Candidatus Bathyarchaeota archaeon]